MNKDKYIWVCIFCTHVSHTEKAAREHSCEDKALMFVKEAMKVYMEVRDRKDKNRTLAIKMDKADPIVKELELNVQK